MSIAIVTTSINHAPTSFKYYAEQADTFIVAGDINSPESLKEYVKELGGIYLTPEQQDAMFPEWSAIVGWRSIQRRNAAIMYAYREGHDVIITVDDDNTPVSDTWAEQHVQNLRSVETSWVMKSLEVRQWVNINADTVPKTRQRGTPYGFATEHMWITSDVAHDNIAVSVSQVLGSPDCDAITRLITDPDVTSAGRDFVVRPYDGTRLAFNSQATAWKREYAPLMACLPGVGRYDDILAAFVAQRVLGAHQQAIHVGSPYVRQYRNPHNHINDISAEMLGLEMSYTWMRQIVRAMSELPETIQEAYDLIAYFLEPYVPTQTYEFMKAWLKDWNNTK
jgi:hypothetical protein